MSGMIAYGSLMSMAELERHGIRRRAACPVTVLGFRRSFSQEPSWREGTGSRRGVLTVSPSDRDSINAILISEVSESTLAELDERERGYDRVAVQESKILPSGVCRPGRIRRNDVFIYVGKPHKSNSGLRPNAEYLRLCSEAAGDWGEAFRETFRKTTFVSGIPLAEYAEDAPCQVTNR